MSTPKKPRGDRAVPKAAPRNLAPSPPPAVDVGELDLTRLADAAEALAGQLVRLSEGDALPGEAMQRYAAGLLPSMLTTILLCRKEMDLLGIGDALRVRGGPAAHARLHSLVRFRQALFTLLNAMRPDRSGIVPADWPQAIPADAVLTVRQEAAELRRAWPARRGAGPQLPDVQPVTTDPPSGKPKCGRGRRPDPSIDPKKDRRLCEDWKAAKGTGMSREAFARERGITVQNLIDAQHREKYRRTRDAE